MKVKEPSPIAMASNGVQSRPLNLAAIGFGVTPHQHRIWTRLCGIDHQNAPVLISSA